MISVACSSSAGFSLAATPTRTPFQPVPFTPTPAPTLTPTPTFTPIPTLTPTLPPQPGVWAAPSLAAMVSARRWRCPPAGAGWMTPSRPRCAWSPPRKGEAPLSHWVYALAAPFPTLTDEVSLEDIRQAWRGETLERFGGTPLLVSPAALQAFSRLVGRGRILAGCRRCPKSASWTPPGPSRPGRWCPSSAWSRAGRCSAWTVYPPTTVETWWATRWRSATASPRERAGRTNNFWLEGGSIPATNRDPGKMTVVLMTGTTALVRAVGWKMETLGMDYPAQGYPRLAARRGLSPTSAASPRSTRTARRPIPRQSSLMFCSRPEYIQLLEKAGANLIELTGNHNNDWGRTAFNYSLDLFRKRGWSWFGGGENADAARQPLLVENHGNRLAFIGCNLAGPPVVWATADEPGAARCDLDWLDGELDQPARPGHPADHDLPI